MQARIIPVIESDLLGAVAIAWLPVSGSAKLTNRYDGLFGALKHLISKRITSITTFIFFDGTVKLLITSRANEAASFPNLPSVCFMNDIVVYYGLQYQILFIPSMWDNRIISINIQNSTATFVVTIVGISGVSRSWPNRSYDEGVLGNIPLGVQVRQWHSLFQKVLHKCNPFIQRKLCAVHQKSIQILIADLLPVVQYLIELFRYSNHFGAGSRAGI